MSQQNFPFNNNPNQLPNQPGFNANERNSDGSRFTADYSNSVPSQLSENAQHSLATQLSQYLESAQANQIFQNFPQQQVQGQNFMHQSQLAQQVALFAQQQQLNGQRGSNGGIQNMSNVNFMQNPSSNQQIQPGYQYRPLANTNILSNQYGLSQSQQQMFQMTNVHNQQAQTPTQRSMSIQPSNQASGAQLVNLLRQRQQLQQAMLSKDGSQSTTNPSASYANDAQSNSAVKSIANSNLDYNSMRSLEPHPSSQPRNDSLNNRQMFHEQIDNSTAANTAQILKRKYSADHSGIPAKKLSNQYLDLNAEDEETLVEPSALENNLGHTNNNHAQSTGNPVCTHSNPVQSNSNSVQVNDASDLEIKRSFSNGSLKEEGKSIENTWNFLPENAIFRATQPKTFGNLPLHLLQQYPVPAAPRLLKENVPTQKLDNLLLYLQSGQTFEVDHALNILCVCCADASCQLPLNHHLITDLLIDQWNKCLDTIETHYEQLVGINSSPETPLQPLQLVAFDSIYELEKNDMNSMRGVMEADKTRDDLSHQVDRAIIILTIFRNLSFNTESQANYSKDVRILRLITRSIHYCGRAISKFLSMTEQEQLQIQQRQRFSCNLNALEFRKSALIIIANLSIYLNLRQVDAIRPNFSLQIVSCLCDVLKEAAPPVYSGLALESLAKLSIIDDNRRVFKGFSLDLLSLIMTRVQTRFPDSDSIQNMLLYPGKSPEISSEMWLKWELCLMIAHNLIQLNIPHLNHQLVNTDIHSAIHLLVTLNEWMCKLIVSYKNHQTPLTSTLLEQIMIISVKSSRMLNDLAHQLASVRSILVGLEKRLFSLMMLHSDPWILGVVKMVPHISEGFQTIGSLTRDILSLIDVD